jgi:hypothetical protein
MRWLFPWRNHLLWDSQLHHRLIWRPEPLPLGDGLGTIVMGPAYGGSPLLQWTMTGDPTEGLPMTPNREGRTNLPFQGRYNTEAPPTSTMTILRSGNPLADHVAMTILRWSEMSRSDTNLPLER